MITLVLCTYGNDSSPFLLTTIMPIISAAMAKYIMILEALPTSIDVPSPLLQVMPPNVTIK